jgi:hypothetical protein
MEEGSISTNRIVTVVLWLTAGLMFFAAWVTWFAGLDTLGLMLGLTACPVVACAVISQVRAYSSRILALVRITGGLEQPPTAEIHTVR